MADTATAAKETKAQRIERLKREKNPWDVFDEVRAFARQGRSSIVPEWAGAYFKWWGIYTQGDGIGAIGGKGGEGLASEYFMMRIGIPNGIVTAPQMRVIADIARTHARNLADITTRQNLQLHWLTIEAIPEIVDALDRIGLSPKGACGDVVRNVTGCPLAGIAHDEIIDASPLARDIARTLVANPEFYNLPRKFKVSVTGCAVWCTYPEINDVAFTAVHQGKEIGYAVRVGGGLSSDPHLAVRLNAFIPSAEVVNVARINTSIFRDQQGLRESRDRARLKHLFTRENWTAESFLDEVERRLRIRFDPAPHEIVPEDVLRDHVGIHPQRQPGLSYVGASVLRGRLSGDQLATAAELAERFGNGQLRTTIMQNLLFINIPSQKAAELARELEQIGLHVEGSPFWHGAIACTGTEFCKLAIAETKTFTRWLVEELEERLPGFDQQLKLHVTGCPNSCGQHWIADIGLEGKKIKHEGGMVDAYYFCVGGAVGKYAAIGRPVGYRVPATEVPAALERLLTSYLAERLPDENLRSYFSRHDAEEIRARLAGESLAAVDRDVPALAYDGD
jgi:sulfite reductase (ferredoxin)